MMKKISFSHWFECGEYLSEDTREIEIINSNKALEAIEALPSAQQWIPVSERLPEGGKYVLAYSADDDYMTVEAKHKFEAFQITHWMPLPEPWKGEEDE